MVVILSLAAALTYGAADFLGGLASRRVATLAVTVYSQAAGLVLLLLALPWLPGTPAPGAAVWGIACGVAGAGAIAMLYRGLAIGTMSVVSPLTAVLAATIPVAYGLLRGERLGLFVGAGIVCALLAVVLVSAAPDSRRQGGQPRRLPPGILEAVVSGTGFGFFFIALAQSGSGAGVYPLLAARITSIALLLIAALGTRTPLIPRAGSRAAIAGCGVFDMSANVLYVLAVHTGLLSIAAVVTSLYPAATVALAAITLKERLLLVQWTGVAAALGGVALIAAGSAK